MTVKKQVAEAASAGAGQQLPWHRRTLRWGQTNLVEIDPARYDAAWWAGHWRRTAIQGVIVNAGGIVAYYPSAEPLHNRAKTLGDRDLFGEIADTARENGLTVLARMDSNRVSEAFYKVHPDWVCIDRDGAPYRRGDKFITCINSPYYSDYIPGIFREIIDRSRPDGFSDNSWAGLGRDKICYCGNCRAQFNSSSGKDLPAEHDWNSPVYRDWVRWSYQRRTDLWDHNNRITTAAGGRDCLWLGMLSGHILGHGRFVDLPAILSRSAIVMLDHQRRNPVDGFENNTETGKRLHELLGWDKLIPESTPQYQLGEPPFRLSAMPAAEVRMWSSAGFAGGIQPWWHHIGASHEDRRQYETAEPIFAWHAHNDDVLTAREPVAEVAVVWSQDNHDFHGRESPEARTMAPYRGALQALGRAGIPFLPVHADRLDGAAARFRVLLLPNLAAMSDRQIRAISDFVAAGGSVIATSETSLYDANGQRRADLGLGPLFGLSHDGRARGGIEAPPQDYETGAGHSYLRLTPELRDRAYGPKDDTVLPAAPWAVRHPVLAGFDKTDTLPFGGYLPEMKAADGTQVLATYIPEFPIYPPETAWMREPRTDLPAVVAKQGPNGSCLVWLIADIDRCYARTASFEHADLISNAVKWALDGTPLLELEGAQGLVGASLYRQGERLILHLNNRLVIDKVPGRQSELVGIGPVTVHLRDAAAAGFGAEVDLRVAGRRVPLRREGKVLSFVVDRIADHEVAVLEPVPSAP